MPSVLSDVVCTAQLRDAGAPATTIKNELVHIVVPLRCPEDRRRDLVGDFRGGRYVAMADIVSLRDFAQRHKRCGVRVIHLKLRQAGSGRIRLGSRGMSKMSTPSRFAELYGNYRIQVEPVPDLRIAQRPCICFDEAHAGRCS